MLFFGAIDGTNIAISGRENCNKNYINRKGFPSMVLKGVCDNKKVTDVFVEWPGLVKYDLVFYNSDLKHCSPIMMYP